MSCLPPWNGLETPVLKVALLPHERLNLFVNVLKYIYISSFKTLSHLTTSTELY